MWLYPTTLTEREPRTVRNWNSSSNHHRWEQRNLPRIAATVGAIKELSREEERVETVDPTKPWVRGGALWRKKKKRTKANCFAA